MNIALINKFDYKNPRSILKKIPYIKGLRDIGNDDAACVYNDIIKAVKKLEYNERLYIYLYFFCQYTYTDIEACTKVPHATIHIKMKKAIKKVGEYLANQNKHD